MGVSVFVVCVLPGTVWADWVFPAVVLQGAPVLVGCGLDEVVFL